MMNCNYFCRLRRLALIASVATFLLLDPAHVLASAGDIYPEYAQFYSHNHKAAQKQANKLDNEIAQYNIPASQALDRPAMAQMYQQMGQKDTVAQPDFNPTGALPIKSLGQIMKTLGSDMFNMSDSSSSTMLNRFKLTGLTGVVPAGSNVGSTSSHPLAKSIAAESGEKKIIDKPDHADYQNQNQSDKKASDEYPKEQEQKPCTSADSDTPC